MSRPAMAATDPENDDAAVTDPEPTLRDLESPLRQATTQLDAYEYMKTLSRWNAPAGLRPPHFVATTLVSGKAPRLTSQRSADIFIGFLCAVCTLLMLAVFHQELASAPARTLAATHP